MLNVAVVQKRDVADTFVEETLVFLELENVCPVKPPHSEIHCALEMSCHVSHE